MKSSCILLYCILSTASYLYFQKERAHLSLPPFLPYLPSMLPRRGLRTHFTHSVEIQKAEVFDEEMQRLKYKEGHSEVEYLTRGENGDEVIYHVDYHGVTTHPAPTPKHPKPQKTVRPLNSGAPPSS